MSETLARRTLFHPKWPSSRTPDPFIVFLSIIGSNCQFSDSSNIVEHEPNKYDELLFSYKWKTRGKEWLKVERVSTERSMELHGGNCCSARAALNLRIRMKEEGHPVRAGRFMPGEDDIIVENVLKYRNEFPAFHPIELLNSAKSKKQLITAKETSFYSKIAEGLNRTIVDVYYRLKYILFPYYTISRKGTLTSMEIVHLKKLHQKHGSKWTTIGKIMGRNVRSLSKIWQQKQATKFGIWDETEDSLLTRSIKQYRENTESSDKDLHNALQWEIIAKAIPGRSAVQCRNHWLNKLRNRVFKEEKYFETVSWSQDQTIELVSNICQQEVRHEEDVDFDIIRKHFQDAGFVVSRGQIRRQWHTMKIKVKNYLLKSFEEILDEVASLTPEHCNGTNYLLSTVD